MADYEGKEPGRGSISRRSFSSHVIELQAIDPHSGVKRGLKTRHLSMMALAGIIGPGLLIGSGGEAVLFLTTNREQTLTLLFRCPRQWWTSSASHRLWRDWNHCFQYYAVAG